MPPNEETPGRGSVATNRKFSTKQTGVLFESMSEDQNIAATKIKKSDGWKLDIIWRNVVGFGLTHLAGAFGAYLFFTEAKWATLLFAIFLYSIGMIGVTGGVHRFWSHRSFKATWQLRLILMILNTIAFQKTIYRWARDHRVHHKYSDTDADPHNSMRGFFYSHIGWLICKKHPDTIEKGKLLDVSDLQSDSIVMFQHKNYLSMGFFVTILLPTLIPIWAWNETFINSFLVATMLRWCACLNSTWCVNSFAHIFGFRPYDKNIKPVQNRGVSIVTFGEGWHNYHHAFPWDYRADEWGTYKFNLTTAFIDLFAKIGWAYDLKTISTKMVEHRVRRTGDGTHEYWGWGDKDIIPEIQQNTLILNKVVKINKDTK